MADEGDGGSTGGDGWRSDGLALQGLGVAFADETPELTELGEREGDRRHLVVTDAGGEERIAKGWYGGERWGHGLHLTEGGRQIARQANSPKFQSQSHE